MRRAVVSLPDGTIMLAEYPGDMSPTLGTARFRGGPLDGARLPVVLTLRHGLPQMVRWAAAGAWWTYRADRGGYAVDGIGPVLDEAHDQYRRCHACRSLAASPDLRRWLCLSDTCRGIRRA